MRLTETKTMQHIRIVNVGTKCDLCGEVTSPNGWDKDGKSYECDFITRVADNYPEGERKGVKAEFCPECAKKIVDTLTIMGVNLEEYSNYD
jgi:hypothetical protein